MKYLHAPGGAVTGTASQDTKPQDTFTMELDTDLRKGIMREYGELAQTSKALIQMLRDVNFQDALPGHMLENYREIMARFSHCGRRASAIIEASNAQDRDAALALTPSPSCALN